MANKFLEFVNKHGKKSAVQMRLIETVSEFTDIQDVSIRSRIILKDTSIYLSQSSIDVLINRLNS